VGTGAIVANAGELMEKRHKSIGGRMGLWALYRSGKRMPMFPDGPFLTVLGALTVSFVGILYAVHRVTLGSVFDAILGVAIVLASLLAMSATILYLLLPVDDEGDD
jgi:hypothetical protein